MSPWPLALLVLLALSGTPLSNRLVTRLCFFTAGYSLDGPDSRTFDGPASGGFGPVSSLLASNFALLVAVGTSFPLGGEDLGRFAPHLVLMLTSSFLASEALGTSPRALLMSESLALEETFGNHSPVDENHICEVAKGGATDIDLAAEAGFDGVEVLHIQMADESNATMQRIKQRAFRHGMDLCGFSTHQSFVYPEKEKRKAKSK